jgi:acyl transferase domain-containing protein
MRIAAKASVSSFAYQGTNAHCILGKFTQETTPVAAAIAPWQNRRFWFQVRIP